MTSARRRRGPNEGFGRSDLNGETLRSSFFGHNQRWSVEEMWSLQYKLLVLTMVRFLLTMVWFINLPVPFPVSHIWLQ